MELTDLRTLAAVVEQGSISRAAKALHRVPSGVTTRILQLEAALGTPLFLREGRRLVVTPAGQTLYATATRVLELVAEAERRIRSPEPGGVFRIGAMESAAAVRLPRPLAALHARHPRVALELTTGASQLLFDLLLENRLEAIFIADAPEDPRLERLPVFEEALVLVAPEGHPPLRRPEDLACPTILAFRAGCSYRNRLLGWFRAHGREPERIAELASYHAILGGVAAGMGVGIMPTSVLAHFPDREAVSVHALDPAFGHAVTELVWRKGLTSPNIAALCACLQLVGKTAESIKKGPREPRSPLKSGGEGGI